MAVHIDALTGKLIDRLSELEHTYGYPIQRRHLYAKLVSAFLVIVGNVTAIETQLTRLQENLAELEAQCHSYCLSFQGQQYDMELTAKIMQHTLLDIFQDKLLWRPYAESHNSQVRLTEEMYARVCECLGCCLKQCEGRMDNCLSSNISERLNEIIEEVGSGSDQLNRTALQYVQRAEQHNSQVLLRMLEKLPSLPMLRAASEPRRIPESNVFYPHLLYDFEMRIEYEQDNQEQVICSSLLENRYLDVDWDRYPAAWESDWDDQGIP